MTHLKLIVILIFSALFAACGGGGGDAPAAQATPNPIADTTAPVITLNGSNPVTMHLGDDDGYRDAGATATDNIDDQITPTLLSHNVNLNALGNYSYTYQATDRAGNRATATRTVRVIDVTANATRIDPRTDNTAPKAYMTSSPQGFNMDFVGTDIRYFLIKLGSSSGANNLENRGVFPAIRSTGERIENIQINLDDEIASGLNQVYVRFHWLNSSNLNAWYYTDYVYNKNTSTPQPTPQPTASPNPIADTTAPVITLNGSNPVEVTQGTTYTDAGATAQDNVDGVVTPTFYSSSVNTTVLGTYYYTYQAVDRAGNRETATRTVKVVENDGLPPDPAEAGKATIEGIDLNNNGVRDDMERTIAEVIQPESTLHRKVLMNFSSAAEKSLKLSIDSNENEIYRRVLDFKKAHRCVIESSPNPKVDMLIMKINLENTDLRTEASEVFYQLSSSVIISFEDIKRIRNTPCE